nr:SET domain-containing protein SmydA-8-like isoform X1 [Megalopta genalis]XP_033322208.1 SET domain-containing protein SmydA-8-like isoform X1 [Megalopta genalis]XP_033322209.1 SET domain-containing protein SmydA-8-like isoform X1 [Megalopta genalis]XP_033322210.1 SET domain-containing protein SmydA-8-like isoform X1 [Megalopta genalis]XP_033322211.1 SET domain-containing protein SmydA-8-like isoform X1 [Megalopta genalis]XP_033322212.1 SET domain-containing protein SmydA-8-like isoform X1 [
MESQNVCDICGELATHKCSACENVYYCCKEHQKKGWKKHAKICKPYKLTEDPVLGRHYVATRNIKAGEIIIKEEQPLFTGPMFNSVPVCLGCFVALQKDSAVPCPKCGWPLCPSCKQHGLECDFTSSRRTEKVSITEFAISHPSYECINVIKTLSMKHANPETYKKLLSLESHTDDIIEKQSFTFEATLKIMHFIRRFFKSDDIADEEITRIVGILQVNGHEVPLTEPPHLAVYELGSLIEHNCKANCSKSFTDKGGLIIHTATPIAKGDHISICYTDALWGTVNRNHYLYHTKFFYCICDRCKDPSEFGVMFNALKCKKIDCPGYVLPETFLGTEPKPYICGTCKLSMSHEEVEQILERVGTDLSRTKKNNIAACHEFLQHYRDILHPNHFYNVDIIIALFQMIGQQGAETMTDNLLVEKIELCKKLDNLLRIIAPAENRLRGLLLFEIHVALAEFTKRHLEEDTLMLLMESKKCLLESYELLKYEPKVLPEGMIAHQINFNLQKMNAVLEHLNIKS